MSLKPNIILDLDQTIISAEEYDKIDVKKLNEKMKKFKYHMMDTSYYVFERPHLQKFLDYLFKNFNVSVWTAATKDYAMFIIENVILKGNSSRKLDYVFYVYHCDASECHKDGHKSLSMLWDIYKLDGYDMNNTFIMDDYDEVYNDQPQNCIIAKRFEFFMDNSEQDIFLPKLKRQLILFTKKYGNDMKTCIKHVNHKMSAPE
jgi:TFIIF-interacting CTD phosphatase-like protein